MRITVKKKEKKTHNHTHSKKDDLLAESYKKLKNGQPISADHDTHDSTHKSIRESKYKGHEITIATHYEIKVDGQPLQGHIYVNNDGKVSAHTYPAYSFSSTVDLIKKIIDDFPTSFTKRSSKKEKKGKMKT